MKKKPQLSVLEYSDYRKYLHDYYSMMKEATPYFSFRYFSQKAGFKSPNFFKLIIDRKRNLTADSLPQVIRALELNERDAKHFQLLVSLDQATQPEERDLYTRKLLRSKVFKQLHPLSEPQYKYYSEWFFLPMRELILRSDFKNDPVWIAEQFTPPLTAAQAKEGIEVLLTLGLIEKTEDGKFKQSHTTVTIPVDEFTSPTLKNFHREMIKKGSEALDRFTKTERNVSSVTLGVNRENFQTIHNRIEEFRKELLAIATEPQEVEEIIQVNFQLFPLIQGKDSNPNKRDKSLIKQIDAKTHQSDLSETKR